MAPAESFQQVFREVGQYSENLVTFATATGFLVFIILALKATWAVVQGLRLYVFSQLCCQVNFREKYGQWAVISGATDGIGLAMAKELARRGMSIVLIGRNDNKLAATKEMLEKEANVGEVVTVKIDLSDSSLENFEAIRGQIDPDNRDIGLLINNAGIMTTKMRRFNNYDADLIRQLVNVNILSALYLTRMIMPAMVERGKGLVVNVSSTAGYVPTPYTCVYGPTKVFLRSFTRQLQIEYSGHPIDIISLTPGAVQTKLFTGFFQVSKATILNPTADYYAKSALNAISTGIKSTTGTLVHSITLGGAKIFDQLGLVPFFLNTCYKLNARDFELSPVPKRRKMAPTGDGLMSVNVS